jgi:three-Cys-motif partner protein
LVKQSFFEEQREQSLVKTTIVEKYFSTWASIITQTQKKHPGRGSQKIAYVDLFAGPGRYKDGTSSTPLKVLENAIRSADFRERLVTIFNDKDEAESLSKAISAIPGIETLKHEPQIMAKVVGEDVAALFESMRLVPTLFFVDPWGYKGLSLRLVSSVLKDWGCDAVFFFNYNRINPGINNPFVKEHMASLFGEGRLAALLPKLEGVAPEDRELTIVEELCQALKGYGGKFVLPFRFKGPRGKRTSHHLIFVSKHFAGYDAMKDIMAKESTSDDDGVPSFEYNPADRMPKQALLFQLSRPLSDLRDLLLETYAGRRIPMKDIYREHSVDTPYIRKNYKVVLARLHEDGIIEAVVARGRKCKRAKGP